MPKKVRPRYGWQQPSFRLGVADHDVKSRYLGVSFEEIAEEFDVPDQLLTKLESTVLHAGAIYKQLKLLRQEAPQPKERLAALVDLKEDLERDLWKWQNLDDRSWRDISTSERNLQEECCFGNDGRAMRDIRAMWDVADGEIGFYTTDDFLPVMRLAILLLKRATTDIPQGKRSQWKEILRFWATPVLDFWEKDLGRRVTYQHFRGGPITKTHRFLHVLLKPLDDSATRYLGTVLEEERTARRRR
jgi:hypothetical protein